MITIPEPPAEPFGGLVIPPPPPPPVFVEPATEGPGNPGGA